MANADNTHQKKNLSIKVTVVIARQLETSVKGQLQY